MYNIICARNKEYSNMNPLISNYIDIMNSYNKGILIFESYTNNIYTNEVIEKIFEFNKDDLKITNFINKLRENKILLNNTEKQIYINDFNMKIVQNGKQYEEQSNYEADYPSVSGDIINVDITTTLDGYFSDSSRMYTIGEVSTEALKLVECALRCLELGIKAFWEGRTGYDDHLSWNCGCTVYGYSTD